jgi:ppGpp synthetase/RelA/SpoT-type nucleotidyltranferase
MAWTEPEHTKGEIRRAGEVLIDKTASAEQRREALSVVNNWRSAHGYPLNTLQIALRRRAVAADSKALVAQRIKRLPSIVGKLERFPSMSVARMQDLGGCRAVLRNIRNVETVTDAFLEAQHKHRLLRHDDYIASPKPSGYRGVHLVYAYKSDKRDTWNGLAIEVQIRSSLQHAWATAVETVGLFTNQSLKSSIGEDSWLRFFQVMSSLIAIGEGQPVVPETTSDFGELTDELRELASDLRVIERLESYAQLIQASDEHMLNAKYVLMTLDVARQRLDLQGFRAQDEAATAYGVREAEAEDGTDVVLVAVTSITGLRAAYPNYFLDTTRFVELLKAALGE